MDKRSLLFLLCVSLSFFGVHTWFGMSNEKEQLAHQKRVKEQQAARDKEWAAEVAVRTANPGDLPLVTLFADPEGHNKLCTAAALGGHYLTCGWQQTLPEKVYISEDGIVKSLQLTAPASLGQPVLYSKNKTPFTIPTIPQDAEVDLQLVPLNNDPSRVVFGQKKNGELSIPFQYLGEQAIAFMNVGKVYLPVGIYEPSTKQVKQLREFIWLQNLVEQGQPIQLSPSAGNEEFYVLENTYQQLVFSNRGGSLAEINLPLKLSKDSKSYVREIDIDRQILAQSPQNARFPLYPYRIPTTAVLQTQGTLGGYYPLLRRSILNSDGSEKSSVPAEAYAFNIVGDDPEISKLFYRVTRFEPNLIQFQAETGQRKITKTFFIPQERNGPYCLQLDVQIDGDARGLMLGSGVPDVELVGGAYSPLLRYQVTVNGGNDVETISLPKKGPVTNYAPANWISNCNGYLGMILTPTQEKADAYKAVQFEGARIPTRLSLIDSYYRLYPPENYPGYATYLPLKGGSSLPFRVFAGPYDDALLKELDEIYDDPTRNYNPDYASAQSIQGWFSFISQPFAKFLFLLMKIFYAITHSWAFSIILLTIALRVMMYPLNAWSIRSTVKMQELAPKIKAIQERYKKDPRKAQLEQMNLYKESKVNPFMGCLPMFLQMPFLIGMFYLLKSSFPLRGAPFIPGWIDDLAAPDVLFSWGQPIWFIGNEFHLLPILMGLTMYLQQRLTSKIPKDPSQLSDAQKQQKMMGNMMSILFTVMFYNFPSGLNLYFMFSTLLGVAQQWWMTKGAKAQTAAIAK
jgi:YidC/Oxa1 family membrane protein insertase